jgi:hypothetical protein
MDSKKSKVAVTDNEVPDEVSQSVQPSSRKGKGKALKFELKMPLLAHQLFKHTPKTFPRFTELPNEIQLLIIKFALEQCYGELIPVAQPGNLQDIRKTGWYSPPHHFLRVNHNFRLETLRLRPRAFPMHEATSETLLAPPQIDFDFSRDLLLVPQAIFEIPSGQEYWIYDLKKLDVLVVSWTHTDFLRGVVHNVLRMKNIGTVVLINQTLLDHKNKPCNYTFEGPFWKGEDIARRKLRADFKSYLRPWMQAPNVVSLRLTRYGEGHQLLAPRIYGWARNVRDDLVVRRSRWRKSGC